MTSKHQWLLLIGLCTWASIAHAHISITDGGTHVGRSEEMKTAPCGGPEARGTMVYTYKPGETINITIAETIPHPSYFRIAFDADGDDGFETPSGTIGEMGSCGGDPLCGPGKEDYCNNETVLLDHLNLHAGSGSKGNYTFSVTLPNVECANCTLQIIQVMNDLNIHAFVPYPGDDIYYQCIDLVLSNTAPDVNDVPVMNEGMVCPASGGGGMGGAGGMSSGGMGGGGGMGGMASGGMGGAGGGGATSGGGAGMMGMAGMMGSAGSMGATAGAGGGAAGVTGAAGAAGSAAPTTTPPPTSSNTNKSGSKGGCHAAGDAGFGSAGAIGLALLALGARRRKARG